MVININLFFVHNNQKNKAQELQLIQFLNPFPPFN